MCFKHKKGRDTKRDPRPLHKRYLIAEIPEAHDGDPYDIYENGRERRKRNILPEETHGHTKDTKGIRHTLP